MGSILRVFCSIVKVCCCSQNTKPLILHFILIHYICHASPLNQGSHKKSQLFTLLSGLQVGNAILCDQNSLQLMELETQMKKFNLITLLIYFVIILLNLLQNTYATNNSKYSIPSIIAETELTTVADVEFILTSEKLKIDLQSFAKNLTEEEIAQQSMFNRIALLSLRGELALPRAPPVELGLHVVHVEGHARWQPIDHHPHAAAMALAEQMKAQQSTDGVHARSSSRWS